MKGCSGQRRYRRGFDLEPAMTGKLLCICAGLSLAITPAAAAEQGMVAPSTAAPGQTGDRLSQDRMAELVSAPISVVQSEGLAAGRAAFERLLARARTAHGARS